MKKQIKEFPLCVDITPHDDYYVMQRVFDTSLATTFKISITDLAKSVFNNFFNLRVKAPLIIEPVVKSLVGADHRAPDNQNVMLSVANWAPYNDDSTQCAVDIISDKSTKSSLSFFHGTMKDDVAQYGFYSYLVSYGEDYPVSNPAHSTMIPKVLSIKLVDSTVTNSTDFGLEYTVFTKPLAVGPIATSNGFSHRMTAANVSLSVANWAQAKTVVDVISATQGSSEVNFLHGTLTNLATNKGSASLGTNWTTLLAVADDAPEVPNRTIWPYNISNVSFKPSTFSLMHFSQKGSNFTDITPHFSMFNKPMIIESESKSLLYNHATVGYSHFYNDNPFVSHNFNVMLSIANWIPNACNTVDVLSNRNAFSRVNLAHGPVGATTNTLEVPFQTLLTSYGPDGSQAVPDCPSPAILNNSPNDSTLDGNISDTTQLVITHLQSNNVNPSIVSASSTNMVPSANNLPQLHIGKRNVFTLAVISTSTQVNVTETTTAFSMFNQPVIIDGFTKSYSYAHRVLGAPKPFETAFTQSAATRLSIANWSTHGCAMDIQALRTSTAKINFLHGVTATNTSAEETTFYAQLVSQGSNAPAYTNTDANPLLIDQRCVMNHQIIKSAGKVFSILTRDHAEKNSTDFRLEFVTFNNAMVIESGVKSIDSALRTHGYNRYFSTTNVESPKNVMLTVANSEPVSMCEVDIISKKYSSSRINFVHEFNSELKSSFFTSLVNNGTDCVEPVIHTPSTLNTTAPYINNASLDSLSPTIADSVLGEGMSDSALDRFTVIMGNSLNMTMNANATVSPPVKVGNKNTFRIVNGNTWPDPTVFNITKYTVDNSIHHKPMIIDGPIQNVTRTAVYTHRVAGAPKYFNAQMLTSPSVMLSIANWHKDPAGCAVDVISNKDSVSRINLLHGPYATATNNELVGFYSSIISYGQYVDSASVTASPGKVDQLFSSSAPNLKTPAQTLSLFVRKDGVYNSTEFRPSFSMFNKPLLIESFVKSSEYGHRAVGYADFYTTGKDYAGNPSTMLSVANWNKLTHCYVDVISSEYSKSQINLMHAPIMTSTGPNLKFLSTISSFGPGSLTAADAVDPCPPAVDSNVASISHTEQPHSSGVVTDDVALDAAHINVARLAEYATVVSPDGNTTLSLSDNKCLKFEVMCFSGKDVIDQANVTKMSLDWTLYNKPVIIESEMKSTVYTHRTMKAPKLFTQRFTGSPEVMLSVANWNPDFDCAFDLISTRSRASVINFLHGPTVLANGTPNYGFRVSLQSVGQKHAVTDVCENITQPKRFVIRLEDDAEGFNPTIFTLTYVSMSKIVLRNLMGTAAPLYSDINGCVIQLCSDFKLKHSIMPIEPGLKEVLALNPVEFKWKPNPDFTFDPERLDYGLIAQDVEKLIPTIIGKTATDYLTVDYLKLIPVLIKAIQELHEMVRT